MWFVAGLSMSGRLRDDSLSILLSLTQFTLFLPLEFLLSPPGQNYCGYKTTDPTVSDLPEAALTKIKDQN